MEFFNRIQKVYNVYPSIQSTTSERVKKKLLNMKLLVSISETDCINLNTFNFRNVWEKNDKLKNGDEIY